MPEQPSDPKELEEIGIDVVRRQFDGIKFLWQTPETRYLLKLISALFGFMIIYYGLMYTLVLMVGETPISLGYGEAIPIGMFLFILIELARFYWNDRKYKLFPEKNPLLKMKYWSAPKSKGYKRLLFSIILLGSLLVVSFLFLTTFHFELLIWSYNLTLVIFFLMAFITARGTLKAFAERYVEKFQRQELWFFIMLPIPWIFFILNFAIWQLFYIPGGGIIFWVVIAVVLYGFIGVLGLLAFLNRKWQAGYTASQIAASYTFLFVVIIPMFIGLFFDLLGPIVSLLVMCFLFIQGTLDGQGDALRKYYGAWEKKLQQFRIHSEEDIRNQTYDKAFDTTPLDTDVPNAYRNLILGLVLLLLTLFGLIFGIAPMFPYFGMEIGIGLTKVTLYEISMFEMQGITLALFIYVIVIGFRK